jgi:hypothetical protein
MKITPAIFIIISLLLSACQPSTPAARPTLAPQTSTPTNPPSVVSLSSPTPAVDAATQPVSAANPIQPPADLPDGKSLQQLMLYSHENWNTIFVEATGRWYSGDAANSLNIEERHQVWIRRPFHMLAFSGPVLGAPGALYVSDGGAYRLPGASPEIFPEYITNPPPAPAVDAEGIPAQPPETFIPNPLLELIYPIGLSARPGEYTPIGAAVIANRPAYILEWTPAFASQRLNRFWLDAQTGLILRLESYTKPDGRYLTQEIEVTSIAYDIELPEELFSLDFELPTAFAQNFSDLPGFSH